MRWFKITTDKYGWDEYTGFIVRAEHETEARQIAFNYTSGWNDQDWLSRDYATCVEVDKHGPPEVIMSSYNAG